jgi:hypothetical protein
MNRLRKSLTNRFDGDFIGFKDERSIGAPLHETCPYGFKVYCWEHAIELGYKRILWLDSSCFAIKNINSIFDHISEHGYIMQEAGQYVGSWSSDTVLNYFGITRDEAMTMLMYGNAGFLGFDVQNPTAQNFLQRWKQAMEAGMFKGEWDNNNKTESSDERCKGSRHDMTCGSIIANQLGMEYQKGTEWLEYSSPGAEPKNETILIYASGL